MKTYVANVEDGSFDSNRSRNVDFEELMLLYSSVAFVRTRPRSLIGPEAVPDLLVEQEEDSKVCVYHHLNRIYAI